MIIKNKVLFYALSYTWGIIMSLVGSLVAAVLIICGQVPKQWGHCLYFEIGYGWGGVELGPFFIVSKNSSKHTKNHEHGHGFQNCVYGPFMVIISLMSAGRYWYREFKYHRKGLVPPTDYDAIWFEGGATKLGDAFLKS